jgi:subtilisin family serine protease
MSKLIAALVFLCTINSYAEPVRIAVVDSGYNIEDKSITLCNGIGAIDYTGTGLRDNLHHGQSITFLIKENAKTDICFIIIKIFDPDSELSGDRKFGIIRTAIETAILERADILNLSYSGDGFDNSEYDVLYLASLKKIKIFAAAGNKNQNFDEKCTYYPACYKDLNMIVVGNLDKSSQRHVTSNYGGPVSMWRLATDIPCGYERKCTGTSFASAIVAGQYADENAKHTREPADNTSQAVMTALEAAYIQTGTRTDLEKMRDRYIDRDIQVILGSFTWLVRACSEKYVSFTWGFE